MDVLFPFLKSNGKKPPTVKPPTNQPTTDRSCVCVWGFRFPFRSFRVVAPCRLSVAVSREVVRNRLYSLRDVPPCREYHRAEKMTRSTEKLSRAPCCVVFSRCRCPLSLRFSPSVSRLRSRPCKIPPKSKQPLKAKFEPCKRQKEKRSFYAPPVSL